MLALMQNSTQFYLLLYESSTIHNHTVHVGFQQFFVIYLPPCKHSKKACDHAAKYYLDNTTMVFLLSDFKSKHVQSLFITEFGCYYLIKMVVLCVLNFFIQNKHYCEDSNINYELSHPTKMAWKM